MLNTLYKLPELQGLDKSDRKSAFLYAYCKRFRHWQFYVCCILVIAIGVTISEFVQHALYNNIIIALTVFASMTITDYATKSLFKKYVIEYLQMLKDSREAELKIS